MISSMLIYQDYAKELLAKENRLSALTTHSVSIGAYLEHLIINFLKVFLGNRFSVKTGFVKHPLNGNVSRQIDILIIDENIPSPYLFKDDNLVVAFPNAVVCAIEIKQKFDKRSLSEIAEQTKQFHEACSVPLPFFAFCYKNTTKNDKTIFEWYKSIDISNIFQNYPKTIFILDSFMIDFFPEPYCKPGGSYFIKLTKQMENKSELLLSYFLLSIVKSCEMKMNNLDKNSVYKYFGPNFDDYFEIKHYCMRYGMDMERPTMVLNNKVSC
jgi:hypothetical protein